MDILLAMRMFERLLAVGIGGMSIYLGYRLFLALPDIRDASGEFHLPLDIRVVLGRIGPGAFFALFGAGVVALSLYTTVRYNVTAPTADARAEHETRSFAGLGSQHVGNDTGAAERTDARALLRRDMAELNALPDKLRPDLAEPDRAEVSGLVRRVKLKLLQPVWEPEWGDQAAFEDWLATDRPDPPATLAEPAALFLYGMSAKAR